VLDIGWAELAVVGVIVLIVVGPKELPRVLRSAGQWAGKARRIAREFQNSLDDMVRESELDTVKNDIEKATKFDVKKDIENAIDPKGDVKRAFEAPAADAGEAPAADAEETGPAVATSASPTPSAKVAPEPKLPEAAPAEEATEPEVAATDEEEPAPIKSQVNG
jgi:sec-independent protein translocase protein TatB